MNDSESGGRDGSSELSLLEEASKDRLILSMLAVLGGRERAVNERDLFLACWHAFPNTMRWVDTPLPNPATFTASLRVSDKRGYIERVGKQPRYKGRQRKRKTALDPNKPTVVKAQLTEAGLDEAGVTEALVEEVRRLSPAPSATRGTSPAVLVAVCVVLREKGGRALDEGALVELAFHKFPAHFAYEERREFPDTERVRTAVRAAIGENLITQELELTEVGRGVAGELLEALKIRQDGSQAQGAGDFRFAERIEATASYTAFLDHGTLAQSKADELFRALRVPPTTDPRPVATTLKSRIAAMQRIDKGEVAGYLTALACRHNAEVAALLNESEVPEMADQ